MRSSTSLPLQRPISKTPAKINIIGGQWKRTPLPVLSLPGLRPTPNRVRETLFNWLGNHLDGWHCLDLFAGSGALGFEAASRGAAHVLMVEQNIHVIKQLQANQKKLQAQMIHIVQSEALQFAARLPASSLDMVFLDPPFASISNSNSTPGIDTLLIQAIRYACKAVRKGGLIYIESPIAIKEDTWASLLEDNSLPNEAHNDATTRPKSSSLESTHSCLLTHYKAFGAVHAHLLQR